MRRGWERRIKDDIHGVRNGRPAQFAEVFEQNGIAVLNTWWCVRTEMNF